MDYVLAVEDILIFLDKMASQIVANTPVLISCGSCVVVFEVVDHFGNKPITILGTILHVDYPRSVSDVSCGF